MINKDWLEKSIEDLEQDFHNRLNYESHLVKRVLELRKKPIKDFETEDLRIMISQNIALKLLIPLALEKLKSNILIEGDFYEGDLLNSVLRSNQDFWKAETELSRKFEMIISNNREKLKETRFLNAIEKWKMK